MVKATIRDDLYCPECGHKGMSALSDKAQSGRSRYKCPSCDFRTTTTLYTEPQILPAFQSDAIKSKKRFIITSAVNDTGIVTEAHKVFVKMAKVLDAAYLIIPGVYKNPDLKNQGVVNNYTWPKEILPYVCDADVKLCDNLVVRGKTRIQYTAINPLSGMNHAGDARSEIFGHPQIAMEMVPTPKNVIPKMMLTTGSISVKNYGGSKTAKKAEFHHSIGAVMVEIEGGKFWTTQLRFDGEGVALYDTYYTCKGTKKNKPVAAVVYGDVHVHSLTAQMWGNMNRTQKILKPCKQVFHDVHDHHIGSHHSEGNKLFTMGQNKQKDFSIRAELDAAVDFLDSMQNCVVVDSNHDRHLDQWFNRFKPASDPINIDLYYELGEMVRLADRPMGLFEAYVRKYAKNTHEFTNPNVVFDILNIDVSQHGDKGPNGARGSAKSFAKTGWKTVIGHGHTPAIEKGAYVAGVHGQGEYAKGYSSWAEVDVIIYHNGKRGMLFTIGGKLPPLMRVKNEKVV